MWGCEYITVTLLILLLLFVIGIYAIMSLYKSSDFAGVYFADDMTIV
jgi:hypothetical protein